MTATVHAESRAEKDEPDVLTAARALRPAIEAAADTIEQERSLPRELVDALYAAGLFSMLEPASLGGHELDLPTFASVVEEIARADASVGWCIGQANGLYNYIAYLDPGTAREVFGGQRVILANGPGEGNRPGQAREVDGGYVLNGRWMFASGIGHANWLLAICFLMCADGTQQLDPDGTPAQRLMLIPRSSAQLHDRWHVSGLRGTGSQSFSVSDLFVPQRFAIWFTPAMRRERGPLYVSTNNGVFGPAFGSVALGVAHAMLAEVVEFASGKVPRSMQRSIAESATVQEGVAVATARLGAARAFLHQTLDEVWAAIVREGVISVGQQVQVRLAATHATHEAAAVVDIAYTLAGSHAIFENRPFERRFRDVHAVTQQLQGRRAHYEVAGQYLLGLPPDLTPL